MLASQSSGIREIGEGPVSKGKVKKQIRKMIDVDPHLPLHCTYTSTHQTKICIRKLARWLSG